MVAAQIEPFNRTNRRGQSLHPELDLAICSPCLFTQSLCAKLNAWSVRSTDLHVRGVVMADSVDPYYKWLGIRDPERPPNHYRFLGLDPFEDDSDVIEDAAQRQIAHVRTYQLGHHSKLSQRILNELAAAKLCLLDPVAKAAYDEALREKINGGTTVPTPVGHSHASTETPATPPDDRTDASSLQRLARTVAEANPESRRRSHAPANRPRSMFVPAFAVTGAIVCVIGVFVVAWESWTGRPKKSESRPPVRDQAATRVGPASTEMQPIRRSPVVSAIATPSKHQESDEDASTNMQAGTSFGGSSGPAPTPLFAPSEKELPIATLEGHTDWVLSVAFSGDGTQLASASADETVKVWDATSGQEMLTLRGHTRGVWSVAFSTDGKRLASASFDGTVKVWDAKNGNETLTLNGHTEKVLSVAISADGKRLASSSFDGTVKVWDATTGQETLTLNGHTNGVTSVAFSPDGKRLASASYDRTVKVWEATT
ncbi:MAG: WD40 repeat domain-containing protein, partial [Planctomycetia bacterium]|nr:WD40 repeat domain-containing protein [Planctomycetia bacterium]